MLQILSIFLYTVFTFYAVQIIQAVFTEKNSNKFLVFSGVCMLVFWPVGIIHSVRIGNDLLLYPLYTAALYYLILWWQKSSSKFLYIASILAVLAALTKSNGLVIVIIISLCLAFKFWVNRLLFWDALVDLKKYFNTNTDPKVRKNEIVRVLSNDLRYAKQIVLASIIFLCGSAVFLAKAFYAGDKEIIGNSGGLNIALKVKNNLDNYLFFDLKDFLTTSFASPWLDEGGRQYFFNYFFKTSLFGEFEIKNLLGKNIAILLSFLFIVLLFLVINNILKLDLEKTEKNLPIILNLFLLPISLSFIRVSYPFSPSNDFRYVVPFIISFVIFYLFAISDLKKNNLIGFALYALPVIFSIMSIIFFLIPVFFLDLIY